MSQLTPMMQQYLNIHEKAKDAILFFRLGDFYEMFFDDAITASRELEIALTGRDCGLEEKAPMCGVPYHSAENYIAKLIEKGYKVAICEQVENPSETKGIVKREIIRIISPGTISDGKLLNEKTNNYLMSIYYNMVDFGIAYVDVSTGEFYTSEITGENAKTELLNEVAKIKPSEILVNTILYKEKFLKTEIEKKFNCYINVYSNKNFNYEQSINKLKEQFNIYSLTSLGLDNCKLSVQSSGGLINYLNETQMRVLSHINNIKYYSIEDYMSIDISTRKNLELTETIRGKEKKGSLLNVLDKTVTAMGGRRLRKWVEQPLIKLKNINHRLDAVDELLTNISFRNEIKVLLKKVYDLERIIAKLSYGSCNARDLLALKQSISIIPKLKIILSQCKSEYLIELNKTIPELNHINDLIENSINPEAPISIKEGNIINSGFNKEVDEYRKITTSGKDYIINLENSEKERTGIKSLKIKYNKVFGYYIEVTKTNLHMVPDNYIRKQTLANCERYFTKELKEIETKILTSDDKAVLLEYDLFQSIREEIIKHIISIQKVATNISIIDALYSLAIVAFENGYIKPLVNESDEILIYGGRHPVVEEVLLENEFVPNSCELDCRDNRTIIITGPNMAGKSTYIRQIAIITLMAQIGSFIPADKAVIGIVDRVFTRVGASDDLSTGQSTFMVEMSEVSNILKNATQKSLIILDEIGRGTSTFDGLSIAWAVVEYLSNKEIIGAKCLFATHYHELTELENKLEGVKNYCIKVQEKENGVIFLRKIVQGSADHSYGIEVASLAGLPEFVIGRAREILYLLENNGDDHHQKINVKTDTIIEKNSNSNINLFNYKDAQIIEELVDLPIEDMSPMELMNYIYKLQERISKNRGN